MRRSEAVRYARLSALVAGVVFLLVAGQYGWRAIQHAKSVRSAPPAVPMTVQQQSQTFAFSKTNGDRTLFEVQASHTTAFTADNRNVLEDVNITMYGQQGDRNDHIRTGECEYLPNTGRVTCKGNVHVEMEAARDAKERPGQQVVRAETSGVTFDRETGASHSDQPVKFSFPYGDGRATGFTYDANRSVVRLHHDVVMTLARAPKGKGAPAAGAPTEVEAASLEYHNEDGIVELAGPVHLRQGNREVTCGAMTIELSATLRARHMLATGRPTLISRDPQGAAVLAAEKATLDFTPTGTPAHLRGEGTVRGSRKLPSVEGEQKFEADTFNMDFDAKTGSARLGKAEGNVLVDVPPRKAGDGNARLTTSSLLLQFVDRVPGRSELKQAQSPVPAAMEFTSAKDDTLLRSRSLTADYGPGSHLRQVHARQDVEIERRLPGQPLQVTRSDEGDVDFEADHWMEARQTGNVRFEESGPQGRRGRADRSRSIHASDTLTLAGNAELSDPDTDSTAATFNLDQRSGEAHGEGGVRTTYRRVDPASVANFAPQPAHISAEKMTAWRSGGRALYAGHARLWQGDAVIQADSIELRQAEKQLLASGNVNARLPQVQQASPGAAGSPPTAGAATGADGRVGANGAAKDAGGKPAGTAQDKQAAPSGPVVWAVRAAKLTYRSAEGVAELQQNVIAESRIGRMSAPRMDLILAQTNGVQQLSKTVSTGGVTVWQQERKGTAERAEYTAADGRFVLSGGNPTLFDADQGTTTGRELTFFLADDRILVDSGNGTRTVSRHRIQ